MLKKLLKSTTEYLPRHAADSVMVGGYPIQIKRQARKSIVLKSQHNELFLHIPKQLTHKQIQSLLQTHHAWLLKQASRLQQVVANRYQPLDNSTFRFLGQECQLVYCKDTKQPLWQPIDSGYGNLKAQLRIPMDFSLTSAQQEQRAAKILKRWFIAQAKIYLDEQLNTYSSQMQLSYRSLQVKTYKGRWGSCYRDGRIQFNWRLLQAPSWVVNYVVVHELAHLQHANHSAAFWQLVEQFYPQTKAAKLELKSQGAAWIDFLQQYQ